MKRALAGCLGAALALWTATGRADEVQWRAVRPTSAPPAPAGPITPSLPPPPAPAVAPPPPLAPQLPLTAVSYSAPADGTGGVWRRVRAQNGEPIAPPKGMVVPVAPPDPAGPLAAPLPGGPIVSDAAGPCCQPGADCCQPGAACPCGPALSHPVCGLPPGSPEIKLANDCPLCADGCPPEHDPVNPRVFARAEYLLWFMNKDRAPVLATTGTVDSNAILGANGTVPLFGGGPIGQSMRSGGRFTLGGWIDDCRTCGVDGNFFFLARRGFDTSFNSAQLPTGVLARPAFAPNTSPALMLPGQTVEQTAFPGRSTGVLDINGSSALWGAEVNPRHRLLCGCNYYLDVFAGFRYLDLNENLGVTEFINVLSDQPALSLVPPTVPAGTQIVVFDRFETHNRFYGGQVGLEGEYSAGRFFVNFRPKVALGVTEQRLDIDGGQLFNFPPGNTTMPHFLPGGFLTTPTTNMGSFTRSKFSVVPEVTLTAGYQITDCLRVFGGYNLLYWSNVLRPGQQIDSVVDVALVPNPFPGVAPSGLSRPAPLFKESNLWLQGVNVGVEWRW